MNRKLSVLLVTGTLLGGLSLASQVGCGGKGGKGGNPSPAPAAPTQGPTLITQPVDVTVGAGMDATFTVAAKGEPKPSYQWFKGTPEAGQEIPGAQAPTYTHSSVKAEDHDQTYFVKVTNRVGTVVSKVVSLKVVERPELVEQPISMSGLRDTETTFSVAAVGAPQLSFQWERSEDQGATWVAIPGATERKYTFKPVMKDLGSRFRAMVSNSHGSAHSDPVRVVNTLLAHKIVGGLSGNFHASSSSMSIPVGTRLVYSFPLDEPVLSHQWQRSEDQGGSWVDIPGAVQPEYEHTIQATDKGIQIRVLTKGEHGSTLSNPSKRMSAS